MDTVAFHPYAVLVDRVSVVPDPASAPKSSLKPEVLPTPTGVEFVRYRRSCGLELRHRPKTPRMDVRAISGFDGVGEIGMAWMPNTQSAGGPPN